MKVNLNSKEQQGLKSMNMYWEEIAKRENLTPSTIMNEVKQMNSVLGWLEILLIVGEYAKNYTQPARE